LARDISTGAMEPFLDQRHELVTPNALEIRGRTLPIHEVRRPDSEVGVSIGLHQQRVQGVEQDCRLGVQPVPLEPLLQEPGNGRRVGSELDEREASAKGSI